MHNLINFHTCSGVIPALLIASAMSCRQGTGWLRATRPSRLARRSRIPEAASESMSPGLAMRWRPLWSGTGPPQFAHWVWASPNRFNTNWQIPGLQNDKSRSKPGTSCHLLWWTAPRTLCQPAQRSLYLHQRVPQALEHPLQRVRFRHRRESSEHLTTSSWQYAECKWQQGCNHWSLVWRNQYNQS